jgi:hypothetical protein
MVTGPLTSVEAGCLYGLAVGNFDNQSDGQLNPALQIATLWRSMDRGSDSGCKDLGTHQFNPAVRLWSVTPPPPAQQSVDWLTMLQDFEPFGDVRPSIGLVLAVGDLQGRSLVLGAPTVVRVQHLQPQVILGMPPMHVDWIAPVNGTSPEVLNLSAVYGGFFSTYQTAQTDQDQSSNQGTTSFTQSLSESVTAGYKWGSAATGSITAQVTTSSSQLWEKSVAKTAGSYANLAFDASTQTGFDDEVWFAAERHNIYVYPVIGQVACPAATPDCTDAQKLPVTVMFSGPDSRVQSRVEGANLEWYHPVHEPGNVLSYPWNLAQLQSQFPDCSPPAPGSCMSLLTSASPTAFNTDGSASVAQAQWQSGNSQSVTSGSVSNISWDVTTSVSTKPGVEGGPTGNVTLDYGGSSSISTLNTQTTKLGQSNGIGITTPGTFPGCPPCPYEYPIMPFVFGTNPPTGSVQQIDLGVQVPTSGVLRAAFTADPTDSVLGAGAWWQTNPYPQPDLALNHPARWSMSAVITDSPGPNCIRIAQGSNIANCAAFNPPEPEVWTSQFHWMKGLLVTQASASGRGPQITQATAGDQLLIQARVYNYSLTGMAPGTQAMVRFYGQPWDTTTQQPAGDAFLIDEVGLGALPGFNENGGTQPNWALAGTTKLDTAAYADQFLIFWVLVWIQDSAGRLVPEMPDHGLKAIPGALTDISGATPFLEGYSNNVGFYKTSFYIAPPSDGSAPAPSAARSDPGRKRRAPLAVERVRVSSRRPDLNEKLTVSARLRAGDGALDGISVFFYDGHPGHGGRVFDVEHIGHLRANEDHLLLVPFRPARCGDHRLFVVTHPHRATGQAALRVRGPACQGDAEASRLDVEGLHARSTIVRED